MVILWGWINCSIILHFSFCTLTSLFFFFFITLHFPNLCLWRGRTSRTLVPYNSVAKLIPLKNNLAKALEEQSRDSELPTSWSIQSLEFKGPGPEVTAEPSPLWQWHAEPISSGLYLAGMWPAWEAALPPDVHVKGVIYQWALRSEQSRPLCDTAALLFPETMAYNSYVKAELCLEPVFWHYSLLEGTDLHPFLTRIPGGMGRFTGKVMAVSKVSKWTDLEQTLAQAPSLLTVPAVPLTQAFFFRKIS